MLVLFAAVYLEIGALIFLGTESMCLVEAISIRKNLHCFSAFHDVEFFQRSLII